MSKNTAFLIAYIIPIVIIGALWTFGNLFLTQESFEKQIDDQVKNISDSKKERIVDLLEERERNAKFIAGIEEIRSFTDGEIVFSQDIAKKDTRKGVEIAVKEIENYVRFHSDLSFSDLLGSEEFREVVMRRFGDNGNVFIFNATDFDNRLYGGEQMKSYGIDNLASVHSAISGFDTDQFSDEISFGEFVDENEEVFRNYCYFQSIAVRTSDHITLGVGAISDVGDYVVLNNPSDELRKKTSDFSDSFKYKNLLLISAEGNIVFSRKQFDDLGRDVEWIQGENIKNAYVNAVENKEVVVEGPFFGQTRDVLEISIAVPIIEGEDVKGVVVLIDSFDNVLEIVSDFSGLGSRGDNYLIDSNGLLVSPLRFRRLDLFVQSMEDEIVKSCVEKLDTNPISLGKPNGQSEVSEFANYQGRQVLGVSNPIHGVGWCQVTEIDYEEYFSEFKKERIVNQISILILSVVSVLIYLLIRRGLMKKREGEGAGSDNIE